MLAGVPLTFSAYETAHAETAPFELRGLLLADRATNVLGSLLAAVVPLINSETPQLDAAVKLGMLAVRSLRAEMALLSVGYDAEAHVFQRRLAEVRGYLERVIHPTNGVQEARRWLFGQMTKDQAYSGLSQDVWRALSAPVHADPLAVTDHLLSVRDDGVIERSVLPFRNAEKANAYLIRDARSVRDAALLIAGVAGYQLPSIAILDSELIPEYERLFGTSDGAGS
ncbi:hypothetical protein VSS74_14200 [Conexibacter stalactiti]|uniref:Uncharacterized protein n=1 Tax=Conexibacter stalactiti TaxID=1940611 RepID=A0ABU4HQF0_9ACTN|nr:hypothetical protein [Conexibacter stalactiti]MDW5595497.1 hypothetical protein [Conexibacter stalactiti]MEC5036139.1 hypothetical protein [Conexibacter stalactiti]